LKGRGTFASGRSRSIDTLSLDSPSCVQLLVVSTQFANFHSTMIAVVARYCRRTKCEKEGNVQVRQKGHSLTCVARENWPSRGRDDTTHLGADSKLETERVARTNELPAKPSDNGQARKQPKNREKSPAWRGRAY